MPTDRWYVTRIYSVLDSHRWLAVEYGNPWAYKYFRTWREAMDYASNQAKRKGK